MDDLPRDEQLPQWHEKDFKVATANHLIRKGLSGMLGDGRLWTTMDEVSHVPFGLRYRFPAQFRAAERRHATDRERAGSPTLQTLQEPIFLLSWVCFRGGFS